MKIIQIESSDNPYGGFSNNDLLRAAGVKRIHKGWYMVTYNGVNLDCSTVVSAKRTKNGELTFTK